MIYTYIYTHIYIYIYIYIYNLEEGPPFGEHLGGNMVTFDTFWELFSDSFGQDKRKDHRRAKSGNGEILPPNLVPKWGRFGSQLEAYLFTGVVKR